MWQGGMHGGTPTRYYEIQSMSGVVCILQECILVENVNADIHAKCEWALTS